MDRQSPGSSYIMGTSSLPQTPQKLQSRLKQLQRQLSQYRQQILKRDEQIQYLNIKNTQLFQSKQSISSKKMVDHIYQSSLQEQYDKLNIKFNDRNKQYERLYQKYVALENDMVTLEDFATDLDRERKFLADKLASIEIHTEGDEVVGELENKLVLMSTQILRLGQLSRNKTQENNDLRFKLKSKQQQLQHAQSQLSQKQKQLAQYRQKVRKLQRNQLQYQSNKEYQNQSTYKILSLQIQRLNIQINNKIQELRTLQNRNKMLEEKVNMQNVGMGGRQRQRQLQIEVERLNKIWVNCKGELGELQAQLRKVSKINKDIAEENERYRRNARKLQQQLQETRKNYIKDQNQKIRIQIQTSERTIRQQNTTIQQLQHQLHQQSLQQTQQYKSRLQQAEHRNTLLKNDLMKYQQKLVMLSQEVQRLSLQNNKYQQQNMEYKKIQYIVENRNRDIRELERVRDNLSMESKRDKAEMQRLKAELEAVWQKYRDMQGRQYKFASMADQLQMITQKLNTRQRQIRVLQQKMQQQQSLRTSGYRLKDLQAQLQSQRRNFRMRQQQQQSQYQQQITNLHQNIYNLESKCRQLSNEHTSNSQNYTILAQQIRRLNQVLSQSSQTIIKQKRQINLLQNNLQITQQSLEKLKLNRYTNEEIEGQLKKRTQVYVKEIGGYKEEINGLRLRVQEDAGNMRIMQQDMQYAKGQLEQCKQLLRNKQNQNMYLKEDIRNNKKNEDILLALVKQIKQSNYRLQAKLSAIEQDYIHKLQSKNNQKQQLQKEYIEYNRKLRQLQSDNISLKFQIQSLLSKASLHEHTVHGLQQQNSKLRAQLQSQWKSGKASTEEYRNKVYEYEQQLFRNVKKIGQVQANNGNLKQEVCKLENSVRQLEDEKYRMQAQIRDIDMERRKDIESKMYQNRSYLDRKDMEISTIRQELSNVRQQLSNVRQQLSNAKEEVSDSKQQILGLRQQLLNARQQLSSTRQQLSSTRQQLSLAQQQIRTKQRTLQHKSSLITQYENKLAMLSQQLQRINQSLQQKNTQLQSLHQKLSLTQQSLSKQNKQTIQIFTIQITRLNTTLCQSLQSNKEMQQQINNLNMEIKRIVDIGKRGQEMWRQKNRELEMEIENIMQDNHKYNANVGVLNKKVQSMQKLQKDNDQLRQQLIQSTSQKNKYKNTITDLQSQISTLKATYQNILQDQKYSLNSKASLKVTQLQQSKRQLQRNVSRLVSENQQIVSQVQNLRRQLQRSDEQYRNTKKQLIRVQNELVNTGRQKDKYKLINEEVMSKVQKMTTNRIAQGAGKQAYEFQVKHLQAVIKQYESQMIIMKQQMQKVSNRERSRENSSVGSSTNRRSSNAGQNQLQQKYNILESLHLKLKRQADGLREKITEYQFKIKKLKGEFQLITKLTHEYKDENEYLRKQNHSQCVYVGKPLQNQAVSSPSWPQAQMDKNQQMLIKQTLKVEIDRLSVLNSSLKRQVQDLRVQSVDIQSVRNRYEEFMGIFVMLAVELEATRASKQ